MEDFEREHLLPQVEAPCEPEPIAEAPAILESAQAEAPQWYDTQQAVQAADVRRTKLPEPPKKKGISALGVIAIALVCALVGGVAGSLLTRAWSTPPASSVDAALLARIEALEQAAQKAALQQSYDAQPIATATQVYEQNVGCVVGINNATTTANVFGQTSGIASVGSGFIIRADGTDGYVITNYHVVNGTQTLRVTLRDGTQYPALVVGYDSGLDVAVLKIEAEGLQTAKVGDSDLLRVGDQVAAIGNPLGELTLSMTVGYISALDREINIDGIPVNMLQTDVAINAGNSGGPLFDMKGNVIGITTSKYSGAASSGAAIEGIGFALPINDVMKIVDDLLEQPAPEQARNAGSGETEEWFRYFFDG